MLPSAAHHVHTYIHTYIHTHTHLLPCRLHALPCNAFYLLFSSYNASTNMQVMISFPLSLTLPRSPSLSLSLPLSSSLSLPLPHSSSLSLTLPHSPSLPHSLSCLSLPISISLFLPPSFSSLFFFAHARALALTLSRAHSSRWPTRAPTPTDRSFSSPPCPRPGLMASTSSLARFSAHQLKYEQLSASISDVSEYGRSVTGEDVMWHTRPCHVLLLHGDVRGIPGKR